MIGLTGSAALAEPAGMTALAFSADHQDRAVEGVVWYPAGNGGQLTVYADNPVWVGIVVSQDATVADGAHPVILLSHGLGGNVRSLTWLATGLAKLGAVVVAVNHPGSTTGDLDLMRSMQHWTRVQDLQAALDAVLADPRFAGHVDADRVYAAGFSLGGWTALSIGGVLGDSMAQAEHCRLAGPKSTHCMDLARAGIDLTKQDVAKWGRSYRDPRIKAVAAIDPAFTHGTTADSVKDVVGNLTLIGLGVGNDRLLAADFSDAGSGFVRLVPAARVVTIAPAFHFSGLMLCKPAGAEILAADNDDPVCSDPPGADRAAIHQQIVDTIATAFQLK